MKKKYLLHNVRCFCSQPREYNSISHLFTVHITGDNFIKLKISGCYQIHVHIYWYMYLSVYETADFINYHTLDRGCFYDGHEIVLQ